MQRSGEGENAVIGYKDRNGRIARVEGRVVRTGLGCRIARRESGISVVQGERGSEK